MSKHLVKFVFILQFCVLFEGFCVMHNIKVWDGYMRFVHENNGPTTLSDTYIPEFNIGDTVRFSNLDFPYSSGEFHTLTSVSIPMEAEEFDYLFSNEQDTVYYYVLKKSGNYNFVCAPHEDMGMTGSFVVKDIETGNIIITSSLDYSIKYGILSLSESVDLISLANLKGDIYYSGENQIIDLNKYKYEYLIISYLKNSVLYTNKLFIED